MIWRLRLLLERSGKRAGIAAGIVVVLVAAGAVFAFTRGGDDKSAATTQDTTPTASTNLFYLRALAPQVRRTGCTMNIRFTWKPDFHANQYIGATALITTTGAGIEGTYRKRFKATGVSLDVGPVSLAGGYKIWAARLTSLDGDPPGNNTLIQAASPQAQECG